jgi:hypothetical protein
VNFNFLFNTRSWQSILAADVHAAIKRGMETSGKERRINLIDYEATVEHVLMSIGPHRTGERPGKRHLISGASARLTLRAAPDIQLNAGVSNFWQKRQGSQPQAPDALATLARQRAQQKGPQDA